LEEREIQCFYQEQQGLVLKILPIVEIKNRLKNGKQILTKGKFSIIARKALLIIYYSY
jgi:hypothetical protein